VVDGFGQLMVVNKIVVEMTDQTMIIVLEVLQLV
jgi:hypothetical protein